MESAPETLPEKKGIMYTLKLRNLLPISKLEEPAMFKAYCDILFCHRALWRIGIRHGDITVANMMWDKEDGNGVLNDLDLAKPVSLGVEITGTLPFMALDLLTKEGMQGQIPSLYRHEAESLTWVLIYLCYSITKREDGQFALIVNDHIKKWFTHTNPEPIQLAKLALSALWNTQDLRPLLYAKSLPLARVLIFWKTRYLTRELAIQNYTYAVLLEEDPLPAIGHLVALSVPVPEPYKEPADETTWEELVRQHARTLDKKAFAYLERLWNTYDATQWPTTFDTLERNENVAPP